VAQLSVFEFVPNVKAQETQQNVFGNPSLPSWKNITVTVAGDGKSFTVDNADNLTWTFTYGANKYDSIYQNGVQIVKDELWMLQVYDGSWKDIGSSVNVFYEQVASYNVRVTQSYTSKNGDYNVTWDFYGGFRPKISFVVNLTVAGDYRVDWRTYVYKDYAVNMTNYVRFWNGVEEAVVFDYSDVYEAFGNITMVEGVEGWVKGKRFDLIFNVGSLSVGFFRLDPNFGYETKGATALTVENYIRGSKFWIFGEGMLGNITVYLYVTTAAHNVKCAIYNSTFNLLGSTETKSVAKNTNTWVTFNFASPVWLPVNSYYWLCVWGNAASGDAVAYYDAGDADKGLYKSSTFGDWQTTLTGYTLATTKFSIYGTYQSYSTVKFGYETIGTNSYIIEDYIGGSVFTITEAGTADSITVALKWGVVAWTGKIKCAIYLHSDLSLKGTTEERTIALTSTFTWYTFNFPAPKPSLTASTEYILVVWAEAIGGFPNPDVEVAYDTGDTNQGHNQPLTYTGTFPDPWTGVGHYIEKVSIYCTYTAAGGGPLNFYGTAPLTFSATIQKIVSFNRYGTSTLTFTATATFLKSQILNFLGSALLTLSSSISKAFTFNRYGLSTLAFASTSEKQFSLGRFGVATLTFLAEGLSSFISAQTLNLFGSANLNFVTNILRTFTFNRYGTSTLTFMTAYEKLASFGRWGTSTLTFATTYEKLVSLTRFGTSTLTFLVESFQNIISAKTLNFYGSANLNFVTNLLKTFSLNRYGTSTLTFTVDTIQNFLRTLTFHGSANLNFLTEMLKTFSLTRYGTAPLTFTIESLVQGLGTWLNLYGSASLAFNIQHYLNMVTPPIDLALVLACFAVVMAIVAIGLVATKKD
jgi:hypothetical protein